MLHTSSNEVPIAKEFVSQKKKDQAEKLQSDDERSLLDTQNDAHHPRKYILNFLKPKQMGKDQKHLLFQIWKES